MPIRGFWASFRTDLNSATVLFLPKRLTSDTGIPDWFQLNFTISRSPYITAILYQNPRRMKRGRLPLAVHQHRHCVCIVDDGKEEENSDGWGSR